MKVIDLLNKIANGEEVPKKIKYENYVYEYEQEHLDYQKIGSNMDIYLFEHHSNFILNCEVEIIEEDKEIELIPIKDFNISYNLGFIDYKNIEVLKEYLNKDFQVIFDTLDLLILNQKKLGKAVNELKKGK